MTRPRILIPTPTSFDAEYNTQCWPEYAAAVKAAGGDPIQIPLTHSAAELRQLVSAAQAVLLPGSGADVDPSAYGHERDAACAEPDPLRERTDAGLFEAVERSRTPLLGICFGTQSMNVFYGGTLTQDCSPVPVNHRAGRSVAAAHIAQFSVDSRLGSILAAADDVTLGPPPYGRLAVNSSHHQAISIPGDTLRVVALCPEDAVIEAVEGTSSDHWLVGVQWHPERTYHCSSASRAIFNSFLKAAGA